MTTLTDDLVSRFAEAMRAKLEEAEKKYGYKDEWLDGNWEDIYRYEFMRHIEKGDPRDVAIYAAFMWHHGWSTKA